ncbi:MAG TPA: hypothetical protein VK835_11370 [Bacteroidia bacterium]|jgi:hypothetical protein|nr:hypothetical protein [Bacteroidia bacterium]
MRRNNYILAIILILTFGTAFAHEDFWTFADYGNVKVRIKTGFDYEEINKAFIIGQLAEKLSKELNYSGPIFLDFNHHYTGECKPAYFISYDKGKIDYTWESTTKEKDYLKANAIVVRQVSRRFDVISTLKLLEYSISNIFSIKTSQKQIEYNENYCQWRINTIDTNIIKKIINAPASELLTNILKTRIERQEQTEYKYSTTYYFQNNIYTIYNNNFDKTKTDILTLPCVYQIIETDFSGTLIFDTDSSFYNVKYDPSNKSYDLSSKYIIHNKGNLYPFQPFTSGALLSYFLENKVKKEK